MRICFIILCTVLFFCNNIISQEDKNVQSTIDQLTQKGGVESLVHALELVEKSGINKNRSALLFEISNSYLEKNNKPYALSYAMQLLNDSKNKNVGSKELYQLHLYIGDIFSSEKLSSNALKHFHQAKVLLEDDREEQNRLNQKFAENYLMEGKVDSALYFREQILAFHLKENNRQAIVDTRRDIISILTKDQQYEAALVQNLVIKDILTKQDDPALLAKIQNNIGYSHNYLKNYEQAYESFQVAEKLNKRNDYIDEAVLFTNMGIALGNLGQMRKAISYLLDAEKILKDQNKLAELSRLYHLIATVYFTNEDIYNALAYNVKAGKLAEKHKFTDIISDSYYTSANIYKELYEYEKAYTFYEKHLILRDSILRNERNNIEELKRQQGEIERSEKEIKLKLVNQEFQDFKIDALEIEKEKLILESEKLKLEAERKEDEVELLRQQQAIRESEFENKELIAQKAQQELELAEQKLLAQESDQQLLALAQKEKLAQVELEKNAAQEKERKIEISLLTKETELLTKDKALLSNEKKISDLQLKQEANFRNTAYGVGGLLGMMLLMFLGGLINSSRKNRLLGKQKTEIETQRDEIESSRDLIEQERTKAEALLLNILPKETAAELKEAGVAKARQYEQATIMFTDFSKFTMLVENLNADELLKELNTYFLAFDEICEQHNIEKIKTIGDSFMCAGGIPVENTTHASDTVQAAIAMQKFVDQTNRTRKQKSQPPWEMRIGIHTGPVIAGVVGSKKFAYDIWGDAVNIASRMETACENGRINISAETYHLVKNDFKCEQRGEIEVKNKGKVEMYFVEALA